MKLFSTRLAAKVFLLAFLFLGACDKSPTEPKENTCAPKKCVAIIERVDRVDSLVVKVP